MTRLEDLARKVEELEGIIQRVEHQMGALSPLAGKVNDVEVAR